MYLEINFIIIEHRKILKLKKIFNMLQKIKIEKYVKIYEIQFLIYIICI